MVDHYVSAAAGTELAGAITSAATIVGVVFLILHYF